MASMTDESQTFLARWSRRKALARTGEAPEPAPSADAAPPAEAEDDTDEIPLEDLPPIESIDAGTDLAPWLRKKVPEAWKRAALSRMWAADPSISEFVGLADYAWDWNAPDGVPGFGPLRAADNVAELLAQAVGQAPRPARKEEAAEKAAGIAEISQAEPPAGEIKGALPENASDGAPPAEQRLTETEALDPAPENSPVGREEPIRRRRGGGALPS
jgi:hypothetical protein